MDEDEKEYPRSKEREPWEKIANANLLYPAAVAAAYFPPNPNGIGVVVFVVTLPQIVVR